MIINRQRKIQEIPITKDTQNTITYQKSRGKLVSHPRFNLRLGWLFTVPYGATNGIPPVAQTYNTTYLPSLQIPY